MDGTKAIRGGIPLVFPQFGRPDESMPQHGFLRTNLWEVDESSRYDNEESAGVTLVLPLSKAVHSRGGTWSMHNAAYDCTMTLAVKVTPGSLMTTLTVDNTGDTPFDFQALFHTYLKVDNALDPTTCHVTGLEGYQCEDKITDETYQLGKDPIVIDGNVDRIYTPPPDDETKNHLTVSVQTGAIASTAPRVQVTANGMVDGMVVPVSAVVWNPHEAKAKEMSDFGDEQYVNMVCVEPGLLTNIPAVKENAVFTQILTAM